MDANTFHKNGNRILCCAKVNLMIGARKNIVGYAIDEDEFVMRIRINGEKEMLEMKRPRCKDGRHMYETLGSDSHSLAELWPVRIKINSTGIFSFILSSKNLNGIV